MKGRKLSLEEVLQLEDGCKVWVEELKERYSELSGVHYKKEEHLIEQNECGAYAIDDIVEFYSDDLEFYEWIDGVKSINISGVKDGMNGEYYNKSIVHNLATEICNLRSLDLTDENIEMIIEEFS